MCVWIALLCRVTVMSVRPQLDAMAMPRTSGDSAGVEQLPRILVLLLPHRPSLISRPPPIRLLGGKSTHGQRGVDGGLAGQHLKMAVAVSKMAKQNG